MFRTPRIVAIRATAWCRCSVAVGITIAAASTTTVSASATTGTIKLSLQAVRRRRTSSITVISTAASTKAAASASAGAKITSTPECAEATEAVTAAAAHVTPLGKLRWNYLVCLFEDTDQLLRHLALVVGEEGVRFAGGIGAPRAANTMDVVLRLLRVIVVDYHLDSVDIVNFIISSEPFHASKSSYSFFSRAHVLCSFHYSHLNLLLDTPPTVARRGGV